MFYGCSNLNSVTTYANDISALNCINNWLNNVAATGDFYNEGSATYTVDSPSGIPTGWTEHTQRTDYFYIKNSNSTVTLTIKKSNSSAPTIEVFKSTDQVNWTSMGTTSTTGITATLNDQPLYLKATTNAWANGTESFNYFETSGQYPTHTIGGNIMSLLYGDNYNGQQLSSNNAWAFAGLFWYDTHLIRATSLILPSNTAPYCYTGMFMYSYIQYPPTLPATSLDWSCYESMFVGSKVRTITLPASTLAMNCYKQMFNSSSIKTVITYANDISATSCLYNWMANVPSTGDFYNLGTATYPSSASGIPSGWTVHTSL